MMIAFRAATVITDVLAGSAVDDATVLVEDDRISWVGPAAGAPPHEQAAVVDLGGRVLFPGLMDAHVHLAFDAGADPVASMLARDEQAQLDGMRLSARQLVESGVTFARDLGAPRGLSARIRDEIRNGTTPGPRLMVAGRPLTRPNGHCWFMGNEIDGPEQARAAVREEIEAGADLVKVMVTGGRMTPGTDPLRFEVSEAALAAIVDEAHRLGATVAAHALSTVGVRAAAAAGVDSVEHATFISPEGGDGYDAAVVRDLVSAGTGVCPTLGLAGAHAHPISLDVRGGWVTRLHAAGVPILAGTDSGIPRHPHVGGVVDGLHGLVASGLSVRQALAAATEAGMRAAGLTEAGAIRPGYLADLIAVDADPRSGVDALLDPPLVVAGGRIVKDTVGRAGAVR
ncbi:imidazolonepropionase-like amidohydrolase [Streptosporangium album]|uniref:Imidazolonepropionase-like amidohydrolase n=1 Tax=Streptosporangium album TaxID=47479 RepID=A0A7W7RTX1_9ACTN|nr:amidohydrolase family protein [Streptosporangium album]MBB4938150.1 imidazolonepropionase-like amidohydrolase [Streptosporangium album]